MVQAALDMTDTASLFRLDAEGIQLPTALRSVLRRARAAGLGADNDDDEEFDAEGDSDQAILARKSGYRLTDENTTQGLMNEMNGGGGSSGSSATLSAARAASSSVFGSSAIGSFLSDPLGACGRAWDGAVESSKQAFDTYVAKPFDQYIAQPFDKYIGQPVRNAIESGKQAFDTYVGQPARNAIESGKQAWSTYVSEPFSRNVAQPVSNAFTAYVSEPAANAWAAAKNMVGMGDAPAAAAAARPSPQQAAPHHDAPKAAAPALAGEKSNPSTGWSISGMFQGAADMAHSAGQAVGLVDDDPAPTRATPAAARVQHGR